MHVVIINASPHEPSQSNTAKIIELFKQGVLMTGATFEVHEIYRKNEWDATKRSFFENENIVIALPVYAATIPGLAMQFFEELVAYISNKESNTTKRKISFIVQGAFPEACQRKCCEYLLEEFPQMLHSNSGGILSHGINAHFIENTDTLEAMKPYIDMGKKFVENDGCFFFPEAVDFTGLEYLSEVKAKRFNRMFNHYYEYVAEIKGCTMDLSHKPYKQ